MKTSLNIRGLRNIFLCGYGVSLSGDWLGIAALGWLLREEMNLGGTAYGLVSAATALSFLLASPIAGKIVRERPLLRVLFIANLLQCLGSYIICYGANSKSITFTTIVIIRVIIGACSSFKEVGESEFLKRLVGESESKTVISWTSNLYYLARAALGYLSAIVLSYLGTAWLFGIDGTTFLLMSISLLALAMIGGQALRDKLTNPHLTSDDTAAGQRSETFWQSLLHRFRDYGAAFRYISKRQDLLLLILIIYLLEGIAYTCWLLAPTVVRVSFNEDDGFWYGMFLSISGVGGIFGMLFYGQAVKLKASRQRTIFTALVFMNILAVGSLSLSTSVLQFSIVYGCAIFSWAPLASYVKTYFLHQQESALANSALQCMVRGIAPLSRLVCVSLVVLIAADPLVQIRNCALLSGALMAYVLLIRSSWRREVLTAMFTSSVFNVESLESPVDEAG